MKYIDTKHKLGISDVSIIDKYILASSLDGCLSIWDMNNDYNCLTNHKCHDDPLNNFVIIPLDNIPMNNNNLNLYYIITASDDGSIKIWTIDSDYSLTNKDTISIFKDGINKLFLKDHSFLFTASDSGMVHIFKLDQCSYNIKLINVFKASMNPINDICYVEWSDLTFLVTGCDDNALRIWDMKHPTLSMVNIDPEATTIKVLTSIDSFQTAINHIKYYDGMIFIALAEHIIGLSLNINEDNELFLDITKIYVGHDDYVRGINIIPNKNMNLFYSIADDGKVIQWDWNTNEVINEKVYHDDCIMAFYMTDTLLLTGSEDSKLCLSPLPIQE